MIKALIVLLTTALSVPLYAQAPPSRFEAGFEAGPSIAKLWGNVFYKIPALSQTTHFTPSTETVSDRITPFSTRITLSR